MNVTIDKHGHILRASRGRLGDAPMATCLKCGRLFTEPLENYEREECQPGSSSDKLFLDDERKLPISYNLHAKTVEEAIEFLTLRVVWHVSLDHDLDDAHYLFQSANPPGYGEPPRAWDRSKLAVKTGYAVLEWMHENDAWVPDIQVHSLSTGANDMMAFLRKHAPEWVEFRRVKPKEI